MRNWIRYLIAACFVSTAAASPIRSEPPKKHQTKRQYFENFGLAEMFKGINWDAVSEECTDLQYDVIVQTTISAVDATKRNMVDHENTPAWNRYFNGVNPGKDGRWQSEEAAPVYGNIRNNLVQVATFPENGKLKRGKNSRSRQTQYRCKEIPDYNKCEGFDETSRKWRGPSAYTADPRANPEGWTIVFCPRFFEDNQSNYWMSGRENQGRREPEQIHELYTYEHLVIHEWMHNDLFGYKDHIADLEAHVSYDYPLGEYKVYGDKFCHLFAWRDEPNLNFQVAVNADTYAWFFTYNHFHNFWAWDSDGSFNTKKRSIDGRDESWEDEILWDGASDFKGTTSESELDINWEMPENVAMTEERLEDDGDQLVAVGYLGQEYKTWKEAYDKKENYQAENSDCWLSWQCGKMFGQSLDPECICKCDGKEVEGQFWEDERCQGIQTGFDIQV